MHGVTSEVPEEVRKTRMDALVCAAVDLLETGDEGACSGFVEVTARSYHNLQLALQQLLGRPCGIDVADSIAIRHEEEQ